ncbi:MAG: NAD-glutamate dehydrogenase domain-containing protein [Pseudomonadota bacterium]
MTETKVDQFVCGNTELQKEILEQISATSDDQLFKTFVQKFYAYIPEDYLSRGKIEAFINIAQDAYKFYQQKDIIGKKVHLSQNQSNQNKPYLIIKLLNSDKPFIIDSLECLLSKRDLKVKFLIHPVLKSSRDSGGKLLGFDAEDSKQESLIYLEIHGSYNSEFATSLSEEITHLLDLVSLTSSSWQPIISKLDNVAEKVKDDSEIHAFLMWLKDNHFTFLSYTKVKKNNILESIGNADLYTLGLADKDSGKELKKKIALGQINKISTIHRSSFIDYIQINIGSESHVFCGLYGAAIYYQLASTIPILRQKIQYILNNSGFVGGGYNAKKLRAILEYLPREILFQSDQRALYCLSLDILSAITTKKLRVFLHKGSTEDFINILIFIPRERLTPDSHANIKEYLSQKFRADISHDYTTDFQKNFCYLYVAVVSNTVSYNDIDLSSIERELDAISALWKDSVLKELTIKYGAEKAGELAFYADSFPGGYRQEFSAAKAVSDIEYLQKLDSEVNCAFNLRVIDDTHYSLKMYSEAKESLSDLLPLIENLGFKAIDEQAFELKNSQWICEFNLESECISPQDEIKGNVEEALRRMRLRDLQPDALCKLITLAGLNWRQVVVIKALTRYLHQTGFSYGKGYVQLTLVKHHKYAEILLDFFDAKFNPKKASPENEALHRAALKEYLNNVTSSPEDKVLRYMLALCDALLRTNCYQDKSYVSFKFNSSLVPGLPHPVPYAEIFVYGRDFEGVHLRSGKVSRGGLRWSDRGEDYRTEVLGLMKAQTTKNAVIVPSGSKGGFFLKFSQDKLSRGEYMELAIECYKTFLRGLLDLTDNIVEGQMIKPGNMVIYDGDDPYLVVAADKGTATFSDYANAVSREYNFWLGDAFASGGSAGYDHKKIGITARGAWVSVADHFASLGIDVQKDSVRVVGIGDMSGDVFGNGMLLSKSIKLIAAFNHMHIFIDPNPDPEKSYWERHRLFNLPSSQWTEYNPSLISKGGGIFSRSSKTITLTAEIKELLGTTKEEFEPDALINMLLKAKSDLLWNGGIGTYVKASDEPNIEIGDKTNDALRVSGKDLGARVVGEGGNLGCSQRGRIEFAKLGGRINTDFIDNSAGVDCSDHEVNIKIAMNPAVVSGKISLEHRNKLLASMKDQVAELVLADNFDQTQAITIAEKSSAFTVEMFSRLIHSLEEKGLLDREVEFLPSDSELSRRSAVGENMTRPELSVLLSYSKMSIYKALLPSNVPDDKYFERYLLDYFPKSMQDEFREEILSHQLKREIIATIITNKLVNQLSGPVLTTIQRETGAELCDMVRSYFIISEIFGLDNIWEKVEALPQEISMDIRVEMFTDLGKIMRRGIAWFLRNVAHPINLIEVIEQYEKPARGLRDTLGQFLLGDAKDKFEAKTAYYIEHNVDEGFASTMAIMDCLVSVFDILFIAGGTKAHDIDVAKIYFEVGYRFNIDWLRKCAEKQMDESYWNRLSIQALKDDLYDKQRRLLQKILEDSSGIKDSEDWYLKNASNASIFTDFIADLKTQDVVTMNMVILANKKFEMFLRKL